jgi:hypothetical protein
MGEFDDLSILKPFRNGPYLIVPIHYSFDPAKNEEWKDEEQQKYIKRDPNRWQELWNREQEMDFSSVGGAVAYHAFSAANLCKGLNYSSFLPLCLCVDFNVEPMVWEVAQISPRGLVCFIDEIKLAPTSIEAMVREFRNRYPAHQGELWIYGDGTGQWRHPQTGKSSYDVLRLYLRGYSAAVVMKVPINNPYQADRVTAFNLKLRGTEGQVGILVDPDKCPELIKDFQEVMFKEGKIVKVNDRDNPYFNRTHASDSAGYLISREWPTAKEVFKSTQQKRKTRVYKHLLGGF